jgi:hypothetical protein
MTGPTTLIYNPPEVYKDTPTQEQLELWELGLRLELGRLMSGETALIEFSKTAEITSPGVADIFTRIRIRKTANGKNFTMAFVHVFYGEQDYVNYDHSDDVITLPRPIMSGIDLLIQEAMAEVRRWTEERARVGKNYLVNINEGLEFVGRAMDVYSPKADI